MTKCELGVSDIQMLHIAAVARYKLKAQFVKEPTNLRVVVGHANLLNSLETRLGKSQKKNIRDPLKIERQCEDRVIEQFRWSDAELFPIEEGDEDFDDSENVRDGTVEESVYFEEDENDNDSGSDSDETMEDYSMDNPLFHDLCGEWNTVLIEPW